MDRSVEDTVARYRVLIGPVRALQTRIAWILLACMLAFFVGTATFAVFFQISDAAVWIAAVVFTLGTYGSIYRLAERQSHAILAAVKQSIDAGDSEMAELIACAMQRGIWRRHLKDAPWFREFFANRPSLNKFYAQYFFVIQKVRYD